MKNNISRCVLTLYLKCIVIIVLLQVNRFVLPTFDTVNEFAKMISCRYLMIKAVPGRVRDNWPVFQRILETIKESTNDFTYVEVNGSHHVHLNDAPKVLPHILHFLHNFTQ